MNEDSIRLAAKATYYCCLLDGEVDLETFNLNLSEVLEGASVDYSDDDLDAILQYAESEWF